jgi:hypothetical protein
MHLLVVLTAPRPGGISYLARTLASIDEAGGGWPDQKVVYVDGPPLAQPLPPGWEVVAEATPYRDEAKSMWACFQLALDRGAERLTFFEDDVRCATGAMKTIAETPIPETVELVKWYDGFVREGAGIVEVVINEPKKLGDKEEAGFRGACAMTLPRRTLEMLVEHPVWKGWKFRHFGDGLMGRCLDGRRYGVWTPNVIQHVGGMSATGNRGLFNGRRSASFTDPHLWSDALGVNVDQVTTAVTPADPSKAVRIGPDGFHRALIDAIRQKRPYSHLRLGEGETALMLLHGPDGVDVPTREFLTGYCLNTGVEITDNPFVNALRDACSAADSLGFPLVHSEEGTPSLLRALGTCKMNFARTHVTDTYAVYKVFVETPFLADLAGARALLVGNAAPDVASFTKLPSWRAAHNNWALDCEAFPSPKRLGRKALAFADEVVSIWQKDRHDIVLVGAGAPGKVVCAALARAGAVALDVGRLFEALRGVP